MIAPAMAPVRCPDCDTPGEVEVIPGHTATRWEPAQPAEVGEVKMGCDCPVNLDRIQREVFG